VRLRYAVLLGIGKKTDRSYCLIDLKEAARAAAPQVKMTIRNDGVAVVVAVPVLSSSAPSFPGMPLPTRRDSWVREGRCLGTHFGDNLLRRIHSEPWTTASLSTASWCNWSRLAIS
jgi:hypothetical protein